MRPDHPRRGRTQQGVSRARMLLKKNLGWLPGFPIAAESGAVRWWCLRPDSADGLFVTIDRERLRRMEMTVSKLRHRFPNALPRVVEDVDDWLGRMDHLLFALKEAVHRERPVCVDSWFSGDTLPRRWAERYPEFRKRHELLGPMIEAVTYLEMTGLKRPSLDTLDWIDERAPSLLGLWTTLASRDRGKALELQVLFYVLRGEMHAACESLLFKCLANESTWSLPKDAPYHYAEQLSGQIGEAANGKPVGIPERPQRESMGDAFCALLMTLARMKPKPRRYITELLSLLVPRSFVKAAGALSRQVEREESRLRGMLRRLSTEERPLRLPRAEKKRLLQLANVVADDDARQLLANVAFAVAHAPTLSGSESLVAAWIRFLSSLTGRAVGLRLGLFARWERFRSASRDGERASRQLQHVLAQLGRVIARHGMNPCLRAHWEDCCQNRDAVEFVGHTLCGIYKREKLTRMIRLLEEVLYDRGLYCVHSKLLCSLEEFAEATPEVHRAAGVVSALALGDDQEMFYEGDIRAALSVTDDDTQAAQVLLVLDEDCSLVEPVGLLGVRIGDDRLRRIVQRAALDRDKKLLLRLATCTQLVVDVGGSVPELPDLASSTAWLDRYPAPLHEALRELSRVSENAETIADGLLSKDFPEERRLRQEVATLRERLALTEDCNTRQRLAKRVENLDKRLEAPRAVTSERLANLAKRVSARVDHEVVARYLRDGYDFAAEQLRSLCHVERVPEEFFRPPYDQLALAILQLRGSARKLGLRLLLHCLDNPASDFSLEPRNVSFRGRLEAKGIDIEPWLSDTFDLSASTRSGEPYRLSFTREVLDYLLMGFHFDTCLSPSSFNFFSTIANAVDVNKQVVYGKTESGRVIGRCLFTLTDQGTILTYHRYAHDPADGFAKAVDEFARRLASAMNSRLATSGRVSTLVASEWYDDGAVPPSALDLESAEGAVRTLLRTAEPHSVVEGLREVFGTDEAVKSMLDSLLWVEEFTTRPAIVGPFVAAYGDDGDLTFRERFRLAILARGAGLAESAERILVSLRPNSLPHRLRPYECKDCGIYHGLGTHREVFDLLIDYSPTIALRTLRRSRPRGVRGDFGETQPDRRRTLARIHRLLGRDQLARQLAGPDSQD